MAHITIREIDDRFNDDAGYNLSDARADLVHMFDEGQINAAGLNQMMENFASRVKTQSFRKHTVKDRAESDPIARWYLDESEGAKPPPSDQTGDTVGLGGEVEDPLSRRAYLRREQEAEPGAIFRRFLTQDATPGLSPAGEGARAAQAVPAYTAFRLGQIDPHETFRAFLESGANLLTPAQRATGFQQLGSEREKLFAVAPGDMTEEQQARQIYFNNFGNQAVFDAQLDPTLQEVNPLFRRGYREQAQNVFDRFQAATPEESYLEFLGKRGGRLFNF
jgi:hypothetical protein